MSRRLRASSFAVWLIAAASAAFAQGGERILDYAIEVNVGASGAIDVVEQITVRAEDIQIHRGIYRDFPTRYRDRYGNNVVVGFEVQGVQRDGVTEPWFMERRSNGVRRSTTDARPRPARRSRSPAVARWSPSDRNRTPQRVVASPSSTG